MKYCVVASDKYGCNSKDAIVEAESVDEAIEYGYEIFPDSEDMDAHLL
jgi:hypothetical protein